MADGAEKMCCGSRIIIKDFQFKSSVGRIFDSSHLSDEYSIQVNCQMDVYSISCSDLELLDIYIETRLRQEQGWMYYSSYN